MISLLAAYAFSIPMISLLNSHELRELIDVSFCQVKVNAHAPFALLATRGDYIWFKHILDRLHINSLAARWLFSMHSTGVRVWMGAVGRIHCCCLSVITIDCKKQVITRHGVCDVCVCVCVCVYSYSLKCAYIFRPSEITELNESILY